MKTRLLDLKAQNAATATRAGRLSSRSARHSSRYLITHRRILLRVTRNELSTRYAGFLLGVGWAVLTPLVMILIYSIVYLVIFQIRVPNLTRGQYVLYIFSGLVPFIMTSEALTTGVASISANKALLTNTVFPIDLAAPKAVLLSQAPMVVGMSAIVVTMPFVAPPSWTIFLLPLIWALHLLALTGIVWVLSLLALALRDLQNVVQLLLFMMVVASPIPYTPSMVPETVRPFLMLNPFAYFVTAYQDVLVLGTSPGGWRSLALTVGSVSLFIFGGRFFVRAKSALIDYA